jgi:NTP pyrophosphatase (non-canonical NTP hydrolase)
MDARSRSTGPRVRRGRPACSDPSRSELAAVDLTDLQHVIRTTYGERDRERGVDATFGWFVEEVGELSRAIRRQGHDQRVEEFTDVLAWLVSLADLTGVDLGAAIQQRYGHGCPKCTHSPCACAVEPPVHA